MLEYDVMGKMFKNIKKFSKALVIVATALVWFPIITPFFLTLIVLFSEGEFRFDFLMPAELFPLAFIGGIILLWFSRRTGAFQKQVAWSFGVAVAALVGSQAIAVATGIASGEREASGLFFTLIVSVYVVYLISHVALGIYGIKLFRDSKKVN